MYNLTVSWYILCLTLIFDSYNISFFLSYTFRLALASLTTFGGSTLFSFGIFICRSSNTSNTSLFEDAWIN